MKKFSQNTKLFIFLALLLGVLNFFIPPTKTEASSQYFGGRIVSKLSCSCSGGYQIRIVGPNGSSGTYLYEGAELYDHYKVTFGKKLLGGYSSGGKCTYLVGEDCVSRTISKGTISFTGASK